MVTHIWDQLLSIIAQEAGSRVVDTWLKAVSFSSWDGINRIAYLSAPNTFVKDWICTKYIDLVKVHLERLLGVNDISITVLTPETTPVMTASVVTNITPAPIPVIAPARRADPQAVMRSGKSVLNAQYQFSSFVVGPHNALAYAACEAVSNKPGVVYNPLLIYGPSGLGKTHLLHAIGNHVRAKFPHTGVLYQTADRFVSEFINAIRLDRVHHFKERYKQIDVLLLDDIQFISNKDQTQEVFFHIFNLLYESRKQIVCSSDTYPRDMSGLAQRLRSRLEGGLIIDVHPPSVEAKIAILQKKLQLTNEVLPLPVLEYIASRDITNVRELEGALMRVMAFGCLTNNAITLELVQRVLQSNSPVKPTTTPSPEGVLQAVAKHYGVTPALVRSKDRDKQLVRVRHMAMYMIKKLTNASSTEIAHVLNRADHSTILHGIAKIQQAIAVDTTLSSTVATLTKQIQS